MSRKVAAIDSLLQDSKAFKNQLGVEKSDNLIVTGLIVDTSIECDHQYFNGYLKVSLEEILIALWDDAYYVTLEEDISNNPPVKTSLYDNGFSLSKLIHILNNETVFE
jgi:hypothetical protein